MRTKKPIKRRLLIALSVGFLTLPEMGKAQSAWTEDACMQYAIAHNLRIQNKKLDVAIAHADMVVAYGRFFPSVSVAGAWGKHFGHAVDPRTNQYTTDSFLENTMSLNVTLPLFEGFSRIHKLRFHKLNRKIHVLQSKVEENNLAFEVLEAFYRHCFDKEMHKLAVEQRKLGEYYCKLTTEYADLGLRSQSELQEAKARLQSDLYQETVKANSCHLSLLTLKELMNMAEGDTSIVVAAADAKGVADTPLSMEALYAASQSVLPEYRLMDLQEKASRRSCSAAKGSLYPSVRMEFSLSTAYYDTETDSRGGIVSYGEQWRRNAHTYIGISVSLPLFDGLSRWGTIKKEKLRLQQVRNDNERQRITLQKEMHDTYLSFRAALNEHRLAEEQLRADSLAWSESEEKWTEGMVSLFELMEKRNRYLRAKAETVRTLLQCKLRERVIRFYREGTFLPHITTKP